MRFVFSTSFVIPAYAEIYRDNLHRSRIKSGMTRIFLFISWLLSFAFFVHPVFAQGQSRLGVHILETEEVNGAASLLPNGGYVTVPVRLDQLDIKKWQKFFDDADRNKIIPIIRLTTTHDGFWELPTRKNIIAFASFFSSLDWHRGDLTIVAFNEPNHALEWGGTVDADNYADTLLFLANWFHTEKKHYIVLPAALDVAAGATKLEQPAFVFLSTLVNRHPEIFDHVDGWNSHAYPNPGFSGLPTDSSRMSVRSYQYEWEFIKQKTGRDFPVYITETGWDNTKKKGAMIAQYFRTAYEKIWKPDNRVVAITPFLFDAQTKPFSDFSLLDNHEKPTPLYEMIRTLSSQ